MEQRWEPCAFSAVNVPGFTEKRVLDGCPSMYRIHECQIHFGSSLLQVVPITSLHSI